MQLTADSWYRHGPNSHWQVIYVDNLTGVWLTGLREPVAAKAIEAGELGGKIEPPQQAK